MCSSNFKSWSSVSTAGDGTAASPALLLLLLLLSSSSEGSKNDTINCTIDASRRVSSSAKFEENRTRLATGIVAVSNK